MHALVCIVSKSESHFRENISKDPNLLNCVNKLRCCVLFHDSEDFNKGNFDENAIITVYEYLPHYLTYIKNGGQEWDHAAQPILNSQPVKYWISEIDIWMYLAQEQKKKVESFGSHVQCFDDFEFVK